MGLNFLGGRCLGRVYGDGKVVNLNPNPGNFEIVEVVELENTYVEVHYPDATNYEGRKILVYRGKRAAEVRNAKELDPHFEKNATLSPIARFEPSLAGRRLARAVAAAPIPEEANG